MNDKDQAAIDHVASVSDNPHAAMIVKQLITGWSVEFEYHTNEWKITDYPSWNHNSKYRLIEPKPAKPAYRVFIDSYGSAGIINRKIDGSYDFDFPSDITWKGDWIEYDPPKKWPTPLVERIAAIDLEAAEWIVDHWDDLLDEKYTLAGSYSRNSDKLDGMFYWCRSDKGEMYWRKISNIMQD